MQPTTLLPPSFVFALGALNTAIGELLVDLNQRETVIEMAAREGIKMHETRLTSYDFYTADEVFATGSGVGILAVTEIDKKVVGDGHTGDLTRRLIQLYDQEVKKGEPVDKE